MNHLKGKRVLITAGPTKEPLDPVRYITNHSSGKQGYAIAQAFAAQDAEVVLISGEVTIDAPKNVQLIQVQTADEMLNACVASLPADIAIFAAAVCDWKPKNVHTEKMKKSTGQDSLVIEFEKNPDILQYIATHKKRPTYIVGFAAETENHIENARIKLANKQCDAIIVNDVSLGTSTFGGDANHLQLILKDKSDIIELGSGSKASLADKLVMFINEHIFSQ